MIRFLIILALGFAASQFPAFYWAYTSQLDRDLTTAQQSNAPSYVVATLKDQRAALIQAESFERPLVFIASWDGDRVLSVLEDWEPFVPDNADDLIHGAIGLVIGYIVTGVLFAPFRVRRPVRQHTPQTAAKKMRSTIPVSTGNLRELKNRAKAAMREAAEAAKRQAGTATGGDTADETPEATGDRRRPATPGLRGNDAIIFARPRPYGAITMTYQRPPLITRRHTHNQHGPIERVTLLRD